jgi:multicomponent Na+:H+ antiporter subunit D
MTGTLNMADLHGKSRPGGKQRPADRHAMLLMVAFGIKAALFPFFSGCRRPTHLPAAVAAFFSGMLSKVGVYALIRMFTLVFTTDTGFTHTVLLVVAGLTMLFGVLSAAAQMEMRRILSFTSSARSATWCWGWPCFTPWPWPAPSSICCTTFSPKPTFFWSAAWCGRPAATFI